MLVINKIGPTKVKSVRLTSDEVVVRLIDGRELVYTRNLIARRDNEGSSSKES